MAKLIITHRGEIENTTTHNIEDEYTEGYKELVKESNRMIAKNQHEQRKTSQKGRNFCAQENKDIRKSDVVVDDFMKKLENGELSDIRLENEQGDVIDEQFINDQLESYNKLLDSPLMKGLDEKKLVKKKSIYER